MPSGGGAFGVAAASGAATWFTPAGEARVPIRKGDRIDPEPIRRSPVQDSGERGLADPLTLLVQVLVVIILIVLVVWLARELL